MNNFSGRLGVAGASFLQPICYLWQFCLTLLPFHRVSDQLYCSFIQVFGIKLSVSLMGIKIYEKKRKYFAMNLGC